ncbi:MAG: hypothetical protein IT257_08810 [Chitinophagaceae bacterium]|nr:hypothetical protein [Chitinophagaceae bacterium]
MKSNLFVWLFVFIAAGSFAQSTYLRRDMDYYFQIERMDILSGQVSDTLHTALNGFSRKDAVQFVENYGKQSDETLNTTEREEGAKIVSKSGEWAENGDGAIESEYSLFNTFYERESDFLHYKSDLVTFVLNPVIYYQQTAESGNLKQNLFYNSKGIEARGLLGKRIGFYTIFTDNQERGPLHHQQYVSSHQAVPGITYYKDFKIGKPGLAQDYLYAAGYVDAEVLRNTVNVTFGTDKFQIGDGYRSLFLSDFGSNYTFLKINTRFGKFNYQNLYMELTPQYFRGGDRLLPRKYATMHHLSVNAFKWLNIGLFEAIAFGRKDHFDFRYLNPIILYRSVEQTNGSPDNALLGFNFKINTGVKAVIYGQAILDEFNFKEIKAGNGWWANKYGLQLGIKFADMFGIKNLLVQAEGNLVRPFTYSFRDSVADYSNYNQPLAHPYGANFMEADFIVHYKPFRKTYLTWKTFYNRQGRDTLSTVSFGGDIFKSYNRKNADYGISMFNGSVSDVLYTNLNLSYEIRDNLYFDLGGGFRYEHSDHPANPSRNSVQVYTGLRLNALRKQYDY